MATWFLEMMQIKTLPLEFTFLCYDVVEATSFKFSNDNTSVKQKGHILDLITSSGPIT